MEIKSVFVTGGTGNQGGAVVKDLVARGVLVKVLTRDPDSEKAQRIRGKVEFVKGNLNDPNSYKEHLKNVEGIFSVQTFEKGTEVEIKQGTLLAKAARDSSIKCFIYSSVAGADLKTGIPHFESKLKIEEYVKSLDLPYTIIRPASLFENYLLPQVKGRILKGKLVSPTNSDVPQQFVSAHDIGVVAGKVFCNPEKYRNKTITVVAEQMDMAQASKIFSEQLNKVIKYQRLPMLITRLVMGRDLHKMFKWVNKNNAIFIDDLEPLRKEYPGLLTLETWIKAYFIK